MRWLLPFGLIILLCTVSNGEAQQIQPLPSGVFTAGGTVYSSARQADGKIIVAGEFYAINGVNRRNIARLNADGSVDLAWSPLVSNDLLAYTRIYAVAVSATTVYVGGSFTSINGEPRGLIGAIDITSGAVTPWNPGPSDPSSTVEALAVSNDGTRVFVGGNFQSMGGATVSNFVALSAIDGGAIQGWSAGQNDFVSALAVSGNLLYVGGILSSINGQDVQNVAQVDVDSGSVSAWTPAPNSSIGAIVAMPSTVYLAGSFTSIGGQQRSSLAAVDTSTGLATAWNPNITFYPNALAIASNTLYVSGGDSIFISPTGYLIAIDTISASTLPWSPNPDGAVRSLLATDTAVIAGGMFTHVGGQLTGGLGILDPVTAQSLGKQLAGYQGEVNALQSQPDGKIIVGGSFTSVNDVPRNNIARLNTDGSVDASWNPGADNDGAVTALSVYDGLVYVGGSFLNIGGHFRQRLAAIDLDTGIATAWQPDPDEPVSAIAPTATRVYAGGDFQHIGNAAHTYLAALDPDTGIALDWDAGIDGGVVAIATIGDVAYVGGQFSHAGGQPRSNAAALNASDGSATAWDPEVIGQVSAIIARGNNVYVGGSFYQVANQPYNGLIALDSTTGLPTNWNPAPLNYGVFVNALAFVDDDIAVGGTFVQMGGQQRNNVALIDPITALATSWNVDVETAQGFNQQQVLAVASSGNAIFIGGFFDTVNAQDRGALVAVSSPDYIFQNGFESDPLDRNQ